MLAWQERTKLRTRVIWEGSGKRWASSVLTAAKNWSRRVLLLVGVVGWVVEARGMLLLLRVVRVGRRGARCGGAVCVWCGKGCVCVRWDVSRRRPGTLPTIDQVNKSRTTRTHLPWWLVGARRKACAPHKGCCSAPSSSKAPAASTKDGVGARC